MLGIDKFDTFYTKVIADFNLHMTSVSFDYARIQKVDNDHYWLLGYFKSVPNVEFKYKPLQPRFPGNGAILLKKVPYVVNTKVGDEWKKRTFNPSPMENWLIAHFEYHSDMFFNASIPFGGFINLSNMTFEALPNARHDVPINSTGIMNVYHEEDAFISNLPDCELKKAGNKSNSNNYQKKKPITDNIAIQELYLQCMNEADAAYLGIADKNPIHLDERDRDNLRLGLFLHRLNG